MRAGMVDDNQELAFPREASGNTLDGGGILPFWSVSDKECRSDKLSLLARWPAKKVPAPLN